MLITDFSEIVYVKMKRQRKTIKYFAELIGKSTTYVSQVIEGAQNGPKAQEYRNLIAEDLGITLVKEEV